MRAVRKMPRRRLSLFGRALVLVGAEIGVNAVVWIIAGICFGHTDGILGLALLAWVSVKCLKSFRVLIVIDHWLAAWCVLCRPPTVMLIVIQPGLDADHISAIDNATRHLVSLGQLPLTCGGCSTYDECLPPMNLSQ